LLALLLVICASLLSPQLLAGDLSGFWQHEEQPAWIEVRFEEGVGTATVVRNDEYPDRVGRLLIKDLYAQGEAAGSWRGQVYAQRLEEYKDAEISLPKPDFMEIKVKVGFMSRTVKWKRVTEVPVEWLYRDISLNKSQAQKSPLSWRASSLDQSTLSYASPLPDQEGLNRIARLQPVLKRRWQ
jgi:hypothetical protein